MISKLSRIVFVILGVCFFGTASLFGENSPEVDSILASIPQLSDSGQSRAYNEVAGLVMQIDLEEGEYYGQKSLEIAERTGNKYCLAAAQATLSDLAYLKNDLETAEKLQYESLKNWERVGEEEMLSYCYNSLGLIYSAKSLPDSALTFHLMALEKSEEVGKLEQISSSLNNIAVTYYYLGNYDKAVEYMERCLEIDEEQENLDGMAYSHSNIATFLSVQGKLDESIEHHLKALEIRRELGYDYSVAISLNNLGNVYSSQGKYQEAIGVLREAVQIKEELGNPLEVCITLTNLGSAYWSKGDPDSALIHLHRAETIREDSLLDADLSSLDLWLAESYASKNQFEPAYKYYKTYHAQKDSIWQESQSSKVAELLTKYEAEKKELENEQLKLRNAKSEFRNYLLIGGLSFSLLILILVGLLYWQILKANRKLEDANQEIASRNEEIREINQGLENMVEERTENLQLANIELDTFLYHSAHTLRSPLTKIIGLSDLIQNTDDPETTLDLHGKLNSTVENMDVMLRQLIEVSEIRRHAHKISEVKIASHFRKIASEMEAKHQELSVQTHLNVNGSQNFRVDEFYLDLLLKNLLDNAIQHGIPDDEGQLHIRLEANVGRRKLEIRISNKAAALNTDPERLFDMFYRGSHKTHGAGLGLTIARKCVEQLHGQIQVAMADGEFRVESEIPRGE